MATSSAVTGAQLALTDEFASVWDAATLFPANVAGLSTTQWVQIAGILVPVGTVFALGSGDLAGQNTATGRAFLDLQSTDTTAITLEGKLRWVLLDPQDRVRATVWQGHTLMLNTTLSDRRQQLPWPLLKQFAAGYQWTFALQMKMETTTSTTNAISASLSTALMSYTSWLTKVAVG
jgi:hypothetical protein